MSSQASTRRPAPHESEADSICTRRGYFWVPGDVVATTVGTLQAGPVFVQWEAPEAVTEPYPLVLVHGGGGQGTDWLTTLDGRPGWATRFVEAGFAVYVVDRVGHGRSPFHPAGLGPMGLPFPYEAAHSIFLGRDAEEEHTQWPYPTQPGTAEMDQLVAGMGPLPADLEFSQSADADRLAKLLDTIGPSVLVTHSAGGPVGWLAADQAPGMVKAIAAVEPLGPPFAAVPGFGTLTWGLTAAPMTFEPSASTPDELRERAPASRRLPSLKGLPVMLLTGGASSFATFADQIVEFLNGGGADTERYHLPSLGIHGNGHGLIFEANSDDTVRPVISWLKERFAG